MKKTDLLKKILIKKQQDQLRADLFLIQKKIVTSRSESSKLFQNQKVFINQKAIKASYRLKEGEILSVYLTTIKSQLLKPYFFPLDIIFEDKDLLILNKPAGLVVHPGAGNKDKTLVNVLLAHNKKLSSGSSPLRPGIVHRLDKETSGLLVVAKNKFTEEALISALKNHEIQRDYYALVIKGPQALEGKIESWIKRHPIHRKKFASFKEFSTGSKKAITFYKVLKKHESGLAWLHCKLHTGRTHQIRVHLSSLHSPILGDSLYGTKKLSAIKDTALKEDIKKLNRVALHAFQLSLIHPHSKKKLSFKIPWSEDINFLLKKLHWNF
ncbi:MAG: RluA family pseudouridine synthase [Bdellovibrionales bacterium]|nr:RluA family pseudouridine synthase [Bdellovibrionales bacterium]